MRLKLLIPKDAKTLAIGLAATLLAQSSISAATLSVCPVGCDATTFQAAINLASSGDTVLLQTTSPHTEAGIVVTKSLTLQGLDGVGGILQADISSGIAQTRVLTVLAGVSAVLRDLDIRYGIASEGGGILNQGNLTIERVAILENQASSGGGIRNAGTLHLIDSSITDNGADFGGGMYNDAQAFALLERNSIASNFAANRGGGLFNEGAVRIVQSILQSNTSARGGGVYSTGGPLTIERSLLLLNDATFGPGGGVRIASGALEIIDSWFSSNECDDHGGGIAIGSETSSARISNTTFSHNSAAFKGGALYTRSASAPLLHNVTMAFNDSLGDGGAIYVYGGKGIRLASTTIAFNTADSDNGTDGDGGGLRLGTECSAPICALTWATIKNTLIADNQDASLSGPFYNDCLGDLTSQGFNLVKDGGTGTFSICKVVGNLTGVMTNVAAGLDNLGDHGGPTTWNGTDVPRTISLLSGSLAKDAGDPSGCRDADDNLLTHDQRYALRVGTCDIGAFEFAGIPDPPDPLFSDGFESGSSYFWSVTSP